MQRSFSISPLRKISIIGFALFALGIQAIPLVVTSNSDSGAGSLRQTIADATPNDIITFDAALNGSTITLTSGALVIQKSLEILGPGPKLLAINGNGTSGVFLVKPETETTVTIGGLTITNGVAEKAGGGIETQLPSWPTPDLFLTIINCVISGNKTTTLGGGVKASTQVQLTMMDCEIAGNESDGDGGGVWCKSKSHFERCAFINNTAKSSGGGILLRDDGPYTIINCTFSGNAATANLQNHVEGGGAGIYIQEKGITYIDNSTISDNTILNSSANHQGAGIYSKGMDVTTLNNTIVSGNHGNSHGFDDIAGTFTGITNCLIEVTNGVSIVGANNIFNQPAQLEAIAYNGGLTRTHALKRTSPAIDAGTNPLNLLTDQRGAGYPRLVGTAVDIGSYEYHPATTRTEICNR